MSVTAPETTARNTLRSLITTEFTPEGFTAEADKLHASMGDKRTAIGVSPIRSRPYSRQEQVLTLELLVQFYSKWDKHIDPAQRVDPTKIETFAERFRRALRSGDPKQSHVWYFKLIDLSYPDDPTGNKTRFEATVLAVGENSALIPATG